FLIGGILLEGPPRARDMQRLGLFGGDGFGDVVGHAAAPGRMGPDRSCGMSGRLPCGVTTNERSMCGEPTPGIKIAHSRLKTISTSSGKSDGTSIQSSRRCRP